MTSGREVASFLGQSGPLWLVYCPCINELAALPRPKHCWLWLPSQPGGLGVHTGPPPPWGSLCCCQSQAQAEALFSDLQMTLSG